MPHKKEDYSIEVEATYFVERIQVSHVAMTHASGYLL